MIWQLTQTDVLHSSPFSIAHTAGAHSNDTESKKTQQLLPALWFSTTQRQRPVTRGRASSPISAGSRNRQHRKSLRETQRKLYQVQPVLQTKLNSFSTNFIMTAFFLGCLYLEISLTYKHVDHQGHSFLLKKGIKRTPISYLRDAEPRSPQPHQKAGKNHGKLPLAAAFPQLQELQQQTSTSCACRGKPFSPNHWDLRHLLKELNVTKCKIPLTKHNCNHSISI